jgi:hypothetical protein
MTARVWSLGSPTPPESFLPLVCTLNGARNLVAAATMLGLTLDEFSAAAMSAPAGSGGVMFSPLSEVTAVLSCDSVFDLRVCAFATA